MTEKFSRVEFEAALPTHKETKVPLWVSLGLDHGEWAYLLPVNENAAIMIRSSVDHTGFAASTGQDSIRMWLVNPEDKTPVASKLSSYTTRVPGWQKRLVDNLRKLYTLGRMIKPCSCGGMIKILKVVKDTPNKGLWFSSCSDWKCNISRFTPLPDEYQEKKHRKS